jgi:signal transduction histidine kinase
MLHEFLFANRAAILERARAKVAARLAPRATAEEIQNGSPLFLDELILSLRDTHTSSLSMRESATQHGADLLKKGFTVAQVVHDYGGVCQAVTELAEEASALISADEFHTLSQCFDDAIAQAVTEYSRQRDQSISDESTERMGELAHEFRNALGVAMLSFQTLRTGSVGLDGSTSALLGRSLKRLSLLIDSSLAHLRLKVGVREPARVSLREFIEEVEIGATMEANGRDLTLAVTPTDPGVDVLVDRQLLAGAVANLLHNAFKFTRRHGHVSLKASSTEERVIIEVADECGGLPPGKADELFLPFEQRSPDRSGLGLGLSISRKSVEADGGQLRVRDVPGVGCVFTIDLPRLPPGEGDRRV